MRDYKKIELIDDIRNDAVIKMIENPSLSYIDAYEEAKKELIGDNKITDVELKNYEINIDSNLINDNNEKNYYDQLKNILKDDINTNEFNDEQLRELSIGKKMGVDISKIADKNYNVAQLKCLIVMLSMGKNIDSFKGNYSFEPMEVFKNIAKI